MTHPLFLTLPDGSPLPIGYRWFVAHGVTSLTPWHFIETQARAEGLRQQFLCEVTPPNPSKLRDWMPFASRQDRDDVDGFELAQGRPTGAVYVVHLTWSRGPERPGWPGMARYEDFWDWVSRELIPETREWANEDDLPDP